MSHVTKDHYVVNRTKSTDSQVYFNRHDRALEDRLYQLRALQAHGGPVRPSRLRQMSARAALTTDLLQDVTMDAEPASLSRASSILSDVPGQTQSHSRRRGPWQLTRLGDAAPQTTTQVLPRLQSATCPRPYSPTRAKLSQRRIRFWHPQQPARCPSQSTRPLAALAPVRGHSSSLALLSRWRPSRRQSARHLRQHSIGARAAGRRRSGQDQRRHLPGPLTSNLKVASGRERRGSVSRARRLT